MATMVKKQKQDSFLGVPGLSGVKSSQLAIYIASAIMGTLALKNGFNAHTYA